MHIAKFLMLMFFGQVSIAYADSNLPVKPEGEYVVVAIRAATGVHSNTTIDEALTGLMGKKVTFGETCIWLDGSPCANTHFVLPLVEIVDVQDPNLSDATLIPDSLNATENNWEMSTYSTETGGGSTQLFLKVDRRILILPVGNGAFNAILEKPLTPTEIEKLQTVLGLYGVFEGPITGEMNQALRISVAQVAEELGAAYRFADPVISENLLTELYGRPLSE